jgi:hypothetical protein
MRPAQQRFAASDRAGGGGDDWLEVQFQFLRGERARQIALDNLPLGRGLVDRRVEHGQRARPPLGSRTQCEFRAAAEFAATGRMLRRLRKTGLCRQPHDLVDPVRLRERIQGGAQDRLRVGTRRNSK